ncbi:DUF7344 domain-containing protein [Salinirubrum litoreum]|uniref:DUF7344 domain-containing protein n=1 Tax=Salinirubrum litoreum TaxID=1126234 RepID=A0ABD5RC69_9EURY|nr:hypothetical protein [Salinirubrum litoreum]
MTIQADEPSAVLNEEETAATPSTLDKDKVHHLLKNERRRQALRYLRDCEGPVQMRDVAEQVAAWEHDTTVQALMSDQRQRVYIALYQAHLPALDEAGVIDYNQSRGIVEKTPLASRLMHYLEDPTDDESNDDDREWEQYYLGAAGVSTVALALTTFEVAAFTAAAALPVALGVVLLYGGISVAHVLSDDGVADGD